MENSVTYIVFISGIIFITSVVSLIIGIINKKNTKSWLWGLISFIVAVLAINIFDSASYVKAYTLQAYFVNILLAVVTVILVFWIFDKKKSKKKVIYILSMVIIALGTIYISGPIAQKAEYAREDRQQAEESKKIDKEISKLDSEDSSKTDTSESGTSKGSSEDRSKKLDDKMTVSEVTDIQTYNNSLILVMQPDKKYGIGPDLAGSKRTQNFILLQARQAMLDLKNNETAKKGGIVIVSYVKNDNTSYDTVMTLYASPSDLNNMSEVPSNGTDFLKHEITGYYINGLYLKAVANKDTGIFKGMDLVEQDTEPDWIPQDISTSMHSFIKN